MGIGMTHALKHRHHDKTHTIRLHFRTKLHTTRRHHARNLCLRNRRYNANTKGYNDLPASPELQVDLSSEPSPYATDLSFYDDPKETYGQQDVMNLFTKLDLETTKATHELQIQTATNADISPACTYTTIENNSNSLT